MYKALKRKTSRIICALIVTALFFSVLVSLGGARLFAYAEDEENITFTQTAVHPSNNQFASADSGDAPQSPSNWTGGGVDGLGGGRTVSGVMDLATYASNKESYMLPGNVTPESPFGRGGNNDTTNRKVLLINVLDDGSSAGTAYGYTSSGISFTKNRFYMIKAWVRTCDFIGDSGAAIRINGLDEDVAFTNINTISGLTDLNQNNKYGWQEFTFYIASSSYEDKTATISLQVGDKYEGKYRPAKGYAMFDNITAFEISPSAFWEAKANDNTKLFDFSAKTDERYNDYKEDLAFTSGLANWKTVSADTDNTALLHGIYDSKDLFIEDNEYHLVSDPSSANGKYYNGDSSVLVISSYDNSAKRFRSVAKGVSYANPIKIERYHYYRISVWSKFQKSKDDSLGDGAGATFALSGIRNSEDDSRDGRNIFATITGNGDSSNKARGGFGEYSFYVKGSALKDYDAYIECWLGTKSNKSSGIAIFDNITVEEISPADYNSFSSNGTTVDFDTTPGADGNSYVTIPDTGITNGKFYNIDAYEEFGYPFAPLGWTKYTASTAETSGFSAAEVDTDTAISGILPTDIETFDKYADKFGYGAINTNRDGNNVLMLYSKNRTAYCYRSSAFTAAANTPGTLTVSLYAADMGADDYGASLVLKNDKDVIATIEKIKNTNGYVTYTFYIEPNTTDISSLSLEIWLGNIDRDKNQSKLSAGHVYVKDVSYAAMADDKDSDDNVIKTAAAKFAEKKALCDAEKTSSYNPTQVAYSYKSIDMYAYDAYDNSYVKQPYNFSLSTRGGTYADDIYFGIFDPASTERDNMLVPEDFTATERSILMLRNPSEAYSTLSYNGSMVLAADKYYKVEVTLKVNIPENQLRSKAVGATINLTGAAKAQFKDIKTTSEKLDSITDYEAFKTFTFFIKPNSAESTLSLNISLGESDYDKQCSGIVYVSKVTYGDITEEAYKEASTDIENGNEYAKLVDLSVADDDDSDNDSADNDNVGGLDWWLIPSILFAIAILIAIIGFVVRKLMEKNANKKGVVQKVASYDRAATLNREHNKTADEADKVSNVIDDGDEKYESFDDDTLQNSQPVAKTTVADDIDRFSDDIEQPETEESSNDKPETDNNENTEKAEPVKQKEKPEEIKQTDNSFIDRFDD